MPNTDMGSTALGIVDRRRGSRIVAILNGTQTVANQFQCNGPNTGYPPVASVEIGQIVDIVSPTGTVRGSTRNITAISGTTTLTVTYSGADIGTDANGDLVILSEGADALGQPENYDSVQDLDARLTTVNSTYWGSNSGTTNATRLNQSSKNDKQYALRLNDSPGSI
jgi:hypothetical protein